MGASPGVFPAVAPRVGIVTSLFLVNQDEGSLGNALVDVFPSDDLAAAGSTLQWF